MRRFLVFTFVLLAAVSSSAASLGRTLDKAVRKTMQAFDVPGLAIAVVLDDQVVLVRGYGVREVGKNDPVTIDTLFELGSTTKAFTTAGMAILAGEGKLRWDDPVRSHLPRFRLADPCADSLLTLRDLVSHRSGLGRHDELWEATGWNREELLRAVGSLKLSKPIRSAYQYNNLMFVTAGEAVAGAAKMPWEEFMRTRLFEPLRMVNTTTSLTEWAAREHATGHSWDGKTRRASPRRIADFSVIAPAGTIKSSGRDLAQWLRFQLGSGSIDGRRIADAAALEQTRTPHAIIPLEGTTKDVYPETNILTYGLGWNVQDYRGELLVGHAGVLNGFRSNVAFLPHKRVGIAIVENIGRGYALFSLRNQIFDAVLKPRERRDWNAWYRDLERKSDARDEKRRSEQLAKQAEVGRELQSYRGTYRHPGLGDAIVTIESDRLMLRWQKLSAPLIPEGPDRFQLTADEFDVDEEVSFEGGPGGVTSLVLFGETFVR